MKPPKPLRLNIAQDGEPKFKPPESLSILKKNKSSESDRKVTFAMEPSNKQTPASQVGEFKESARFPDTQQKTTSLKKPKKVVKLDEAKQEEIRQKKASFSELV